MTDFAPSFAYRVGGSLNLADNPEDLEESQALELVNVRFPGEGAWAPRRAAASAEGGFSSLCGIHDMPHGTDTAGGTPNGCVYLDFTGSSVVLYAADGTGRNKALVGTLAGWDAVAFRPKTLAAVLNECLWIVDEGKNLGLTVYDPNERFGQGKLWQPSFEFEPTLDTDPSPIYARTVAAYNNFLFVAGYGSEADPDRPELVRFSYLGFEPDSEGAGDAGKVAAPVFGDPTYDGAAEVSPGSAGLFDIDDYFMVGPRGQPVIGLVAAAERLAILPRFGAHMLFGYDRFSFQVDLLDNQRGCVASRACGQANGIAWWWSPLGPTAWGGGQPQPLERLITPRVRQIDPDSLFFAHQAEEYEARWYYSADQGDPDRSIAYNYLYQRFKEEKLGLRVFCAGLARTGSILRPGPGGNPIPDPGDTEDADMTPPSNVTHTEVTANSATARWVNGETGPTIQTRVSFAPVTPGGSNVIARVFLVASGVQSQPYGGLQPGTEYRTTVRHVDTATGLVSTSATGTFTTAGVGTLNPPSSFQARGYHYIDEQTGDPLIFMEFSWVLAQQNVYTQVQLKRQSQDWDQAATYRGGLNSSSVYESEFPQNDLWVARARHTSTALYDEVTAPSGSASGWSAEFPINPANILSGSGTS